MLRKNPFVHILNKGNNVALFNALTLSTVYLSKSKFDSVLKNPTKNFIDEEFFVLQDFNAINYLQEFSKKKINEANEINSAFFLVTSGCNLSCQYCFEKSEKHQQVNMSEETAEKGVNLLARNTDHIEQINFYGGEPLLNLPAIKKIVSTVKRLGLTCEQFRISTNGCLIDNDIADYLKENNIFAAISLDGDIEINDKARKDLKGKGSYKKTIKAIELLDKRQVPFGVSCTIGSHNFDRIDSIFEILEKFSINNIGFNFVEDNEGMKIEKEVNDQMFKNSIEAAEKMFEKGIVESKIVNKVLRSFIKGQNRFRHCAAYGEQIVIGTNGRVGPCHHNFWLDDKETNSYCDIDVDYTGKITDHPTWVEWANRTPLNMPQCWNCFGVGLCGGGCASNSLTSEGSIWEVNKPSCNLTKQVIPWAIWKYYELKNKIR